MLADDQRALKEWGYVALSRAREQTRVYAIEDQLEKDEPPHRIEPAGPIDRLAQALSRPAAETLALDALRGGSVLSDRARLALETQQLRERQAALEKERFEVACELHRTRRALEDLGPLGRARRGRTLREQLADQRQTVARLDRELERLEERRRLNRDRALELARSEPPPERGLTRERGIGQSLERGRSLDRGIEL